MLRDMAGRQHEEALLREWEQRITDAREVIETLGPAADGLRRWLAKERPVAKPAAASGTTTSRAVHTGIAATYGGKPALPAVLLRIVGERGQIHADEIVQRVTESDEFRDNPPKRNTILTRLSELAKRGKLDKHEDGSYSLPPARESSTDYGAMAFTSFPAPDEGGGP